MQVQVAETQIHQLKQQRVAFLVPIQPGGSEPRAGEKSRYLCSMKSVVDRFLQAHAVSSRRDVLSHDHTPDSRAEKRSQGKAKPCAHCLLRKGPGSCLMILLLTFHWPELIDTAVPKQQDIICLLGKQGPTE